MRCVSLGRCSLYLGAIASLKLCLTLERIHSEVLSMGINITDHSHVRSQQMASCFPVRLFTFDFGPPQVKIT